MMKAIRIPLLVLILGAAAGSAQVRTWVSTRGADTNPCNRNFPCRTFAAAIAAVDDGGEVVVLDSGGFSSVIVNKGVSIVAPKGIHAAIAPTSGIAILVNTAGEPVVLSNLYLNAQGAGQGIHFQGTGDLHVKDCVANGFIDSGLFSAIAASGRLFVSSSEFRNNDVNGLRYSSDAPGQAVVDHCSFSDNGAAGFVGIGTGKLLVRDSVSSSNGTEGFQLNWGSGQQVVLVDCVAANNSASGFQASTISGGTLIVHLEQCTAAGNATGVHASQTPGASAAMYLANSAVVHNGVGFLFSGGGEIHSRGDNTVLNNGAGETFTFPNFSSK